MTGIVGFDSYFEEPEILKSYSKDLSFLTPRKFSLPSREIPKLPGPLAGVEPLAKDVLVMMPGLMDWLEKSGISGRLTERLTNIFATTDPILKPMLGMMAPPISALERILDNDSVNSLLSRAIDLLTRPLLERSRS